MNYVVGGMNIPTPAMVPEVIESTAKKNAVRIGFSLAGWYVGQQFKQPLVGALAGIAVSYFVPPLLGLE